MAATQKEITSRGIIMKYKETVKKILPLNLPEVSEQDLDQAIDYSIMKHFKNPKARIENNYNKKTINTTLLDIMDYIIQREPILVSSGVMFKKHAEARNPLINLITSYLNNRKVAKKKMFTFPKGSEDFEKYNLLQLLYKTDTNSLYGCLGQYSCILYDLHVCSSITTQARSCIASAGLFFEGFLCDNVKFQCMNECVQFIENILSEKEERRYKDSDILDRDIDTDECFAKVILECGFMWIPSKKEQDIIYEMIDRMSQEDRNRVYYKNNLYEFLSNKRVSSLLVSIVENLKEPYMDPNKKPHADAIKVAQKEIDKIMEEKDALKDKHMTENDYNTMKNRYDKRILRATKRIKEYEKAQELLDEFKCLLEEFVYYGHFYCDRIDKYSNCIRQSCIITDTDSTMVSLDGFYRYTLDKIKDKEIPIRYMKMNLVKRLKEDEFGDLKEPVKFMERIEDDLDYDFVEDEIFEVKKSCDMVTMLPQEGVRYSIINIMSYCLTYLVNSYMLKYTKLNHSYAEGMECFVNMKNEFLFKRMLLTYVKKNYATIQELQEGNYIEGGYTDIKGLAMGKSITNKTTQETLEEILVEDVLKCDVIDQVKIIKDLAIFEKRMFDSLKSGDKSIYKPRKLKPAQSYPDPLRVSGMKACIAWNELRDHGVEGFDLSGDNSIEIVETNINIKSVENLRKLADEHYMKAHQNNDSEEKAHGDYLMEKYEKMVRLLKSSDFKGEINTIAIPIDTPTPEWVTMFINYDKIINDNLSLFPLSPLGIYIGNSKNNYTNIMKF